MMLSIRKFVQGKDEAAWISVWNRAFREFEEFRDLTAEEMLKWEKSPSFDVAGIFIAELEGKPVGIINAYVDKRREEKKGFINNFGVVPDYRRRGIGKALAERAMVSFRERGMERVEASAAMDSIAAKRLGERMGFTRVRVFSLMKCGLESLPSSIEENREVTLRNIKQPSEEDIRLINSLVNDTFSEHYNYRPASLEETKFFMTEDPIFKKQEWLIASLNGLPVGYVGVGVDQEYNQQKNAKAAWILDIGVLKIHRRKGIGTRLMLEAMKLMKAEDMTEAMLGVDDQNPTHAIKLYEKVGFHAARKDAAYQKQI